MQHDWTGGRDVGREGRPQAPHGPRYLSSDLMRGKGSERAPSGQFEAWSPVLTASELLAKRWKAVIMWLLGRGSRRFNELQARMPGVTPKVLTEQLRELERDGLVERSVIRGGAKHVEYALSGVGEKLWPVLEQLGAWGRAYIASRGEPETSADSAGAEERAPSPHARAADRERMRGVVAYGDYRPPPSEVPFEGFDKGRYHGRKEL